jgi:hypothetical protein
VKRWIERWNAYWFPETTTRELCLSRIVVVAAQLLLFPPVLEKHINYLTKNSEFIDPQVIISAIAAVFPRETVFTPSVFTTLYWVTFVAGLLTRFRVCPVQLDLRRPRVLLWRPAPWGGVVLHSADVLCLLTLGRQLLS